MSAACVLHCKTSTFSFSYVVLQKRNLKISNESLIDLLISCTELLCSASAKHVAVSCQDSANNLLYRAL